MNQSINEKKIKKIRRANQLINLLNKLTGADWVPEVREKYTFIVCVNEKQCELPAKYEKPFKEALMEIIKDMETELRSIMKAY